MDIREGIDKITYNRIMSFLSDGEWPEDYHPKTLLCEKLTSEILTYLHSQGVVQKVEGELPFDDFPMPLRGDVLSDEDWVGWKKMIVWFFCNAGYVKTKPLEE